MSIVLGPMNQIGPEGPAGADGIDGADGSQWLSGKEIPENTLGKNGDYYLRTNGDFYNKVDGEWEYIGSLKGPKGAKGEKGEQGVKGLNGSVSTFIMHFTQKGIYVDQFNEKIVDAVSTDTITQYTVPIGKKLDLVSILVSGENIAKYTIMVNGNVLAKFRTYFTHYDRELGLGRYSCNPGDIIAVVVDNFRNADAEFNATIIGDLYVP